MVAEARIVGVLGCQQQAASRRIHQVLLFVRISPSDESEQISFPVAYPSPYPRLVYIYWGYYAFLEYWVWYFGVYPALLAWSIFYAIICVCIATTPSTETQILNSPNLIKVDKIFG